MIATIARAVLTGLAAGTSIGPVAVWGGQLRSRRYRDASVVILGAAIGDIVLGLAIVALVEHYGIPLGAIGAFLETVANPGLLAIGIILIVMASQDTGGKEWSETQRFATAFTFTTCWPGTVVFISGYLSLGWQPGEDLRVFFPAFAAGVVLMWAGNIEFFYRLQHWSTTAIRAIGAGCVLLAVVKFALSI